MKQRRGLSIQRTTSISLAGMKKRRQGSLRTSWKSGLGQSPAGLACWARIQKAKENCSPRQCSWSYLDV